MHVLVEALLRGEGRAERPQGVSATILTVNRSPEEGLSQRSLTESGSTLDTGFR